MKIILIVIYKNKKPFKIEVDDNITLLELKKKIAEHYNTRYTGFNVIMELIFLIVLMIIIH